ncbi:MAG TPA: hypothetical protein VF695_06295, partial [Sphingomonas sp.]
PDTGLAPFQAIDCSHIQLIGNIIRYPSLGSNVFTFPNAPATTFIQAWANVVPEHFWPEGDNRRPRVLGFGGGGSGFAVTSPGGVMQSVTNDRIEDDGDNYFVAAGTWAKQVRDPVPGAQ